MAVVSTGLSPAQVQASIIAKLKAHRDALNDIAVLYRWTSGLAVADLAAAAGLSTTDAQAYLAAVADANAEAQIHNTGQAPATYPQVSGPYPYGASQGQLTGPS